MVKKVGFLSWLLVGGVTAYGIHTIKKSNEEERLRIAEKLERERQRKACVYSFNDGLSEEDFEKIVMRCAKKINRIEKVYVSGLDISCIASSQSGISTWRFTLDFNDYGKLTGKCYYKSENTDSNIPERLNDLIYEQLEPYIGQIEQKEREREEKARRERIAQEQRLAKEQREKREARNKKIKAFFFNRKRLTVSFSNSELVGKSCAYVVKRIGKEGFSNIKLNPIYDVYIESESKPGEVCRIHTNDNVTVEKDMMLKYDEEIVVEYHEKIRLKVPFSSSKFKNINYFEAMNILTNVGFTNMRAVGLNNLTTGWISKKESVKEIVIADVSKFKEGQMFTYDVEIKIYYHSFK